MILLGLDTLFKLFLIFEFFHSLNLFLKGFEPVNLIGTIVPLVYLYLLKDSLEHYSKVGFKEGLISYIHTFFPSCAILLGNLDSYSSLKVFFLYFGIVHVVSGVFFLNKGFSIVPFQRKEIKTKGPFSYVRHPIYFGNLIIFTISLSSSSLSTQISLLFCYLVLTLRRIKLEEGFLSKSESYLNYKREVSHKLIPFVY